MLIFNFYLSFVFTVLCSFHKTQCLEEDSNVNENVTEIADENIRYADFLDINATEVEDVFDDYMKIVIYENFQFRSAVSNKDKLWEDGIVPYVISNQYRKQNRNFILEAMEEFHNKTCVRFQQRENEKSYIMLVPGSGCSAVVGKIPDRSNRVTLNVNCFVKGIVIHELMHALGFIHEQSRPDRDEFVKIIFDNIIKRAVGNFDKYSADEIQLFNLTYDYGSVMHYGPNDFAVNRNKPTIIPLKKDVEIGQRKGFSEQDLIKINLLYNCPGMQNSTQVSDDKREKSRRDRDDKRGANVSDGDDLENSEEKKNY